jgi:hypothetical protein
MTRTTLDHGRLRVTISVSAGSDRLDAQHIVLHELAHYLVAESTSVAASAAATAARSSERSRRSVHDRAFYGRAVKLFAKYGAIPVGDAVTRETRMHPSCHLRIVGGLHDSGLREYAKNVRGAYNEVRKAKHMMTASTKFVTRIVVPSHPIVPTQRGRVFVCADCGHRVGPTTVAQYRRLSSGGLAHMLSHKVVQRIAA